VTTDAWRDDEDDPETVVVERVNGPPEGSQTQLMIPEQLYNSEEELRYALPFFTEGVDKVLLRTDGSTARDATGAGDKRTVEYRDGMYFVSAR